MEYQDFEFWYCRFCEGELDFDYDRSMDTAVPKTLMDMPIKLMRKITDDLNLFERSHLRFMNQDLKSYIDSFPAVFNSVWVTADKTKLSWELNGREFECNQEENGCTFSRPKYLTSEKSEKVTKTYMESYMKKSLKYLTPLFKIPNLQTNYLWFVMMNQSPELDDLLPVPFYAKGAYVFAYDFEKTVQILINLKAGHLEWFKLDFNEPIGREYSIRIFETDQFKQAQSVQILRAKLNLEDLENFSHLKHFSCFLNAIEPKEILRIRDIVFAFKKLEKCTIKCVRNGNQIRPLAEVLKEVVPEGPVESFIHRYKKPEFNVTLEFNIQEKGAYFSIDVLKV
ncbi:unnamed protein product [Caenorhabditis nigoni]